MSLWTRTVQVFKRRPLLMNMATFGTMYVSAEVAQQCILLRMDPEKKVMDWSSVGRYAVIGLVAIGPTLFYWYRILDKLMPAATALVVSRKVLTDQLLMTPCCISMFFIGMSILEGKKDLFAELKAKFVPTYTVSCCFWLPAQAINFGFLPPYTRVAFVGCASFVWVNILCLMKRKKVAESEKDVELVSGL